jgi:thiol:disulfide interchange protein
MQIQWRHDVDQVLKEARTQGKPVLLDFTAAPM